LAETIIGLLKSEVIVRRAWRSREVVELVTLDGVKWFKHKRLLGPIGHIPPAETKANRYRPQANLAEAT